MFRFSLLQYSFETQNVNKSVIILDGVNVDVAAEDNHLEVVNDKGEVFLLVDYHLGDQKFSVRLADDYHLVLTFNGRQMHVAFHSAALDDEIEPVAMAGLVGLTFPRPVDRVLTELEKHQVWIMMTLPGIKASGAVSQDMNAEGRMWTTCCVRRAFILSRENSQLGEPVYYARTRCFSIARPHSSSDFVPRSSRLGGFPICTCACIQR